MPSIPNLAPTRTKRALRLLTTALCAGTLLSGCAATDRLGRIGEAPPLSQIENPVQRPDYRPVSLPMPAPQLDQPNRNSLWQTGSRSFFKDQRAGEIGDILTVLIEINDTASINNATNRARSSNNSAGINGLFGFEDRLDTVLPNSVDAGSLVDLGSDDSLSGSGSIQRGESIEMKIAALITQKLPNGNLVIQGRQEVQVNHEVRDLLIAGVVRPEDIRSDNTISYDKIAEARIAYGGRGTLSDVQYPRYGQEIYDVLFPF